MLQMIFIVSVENNFLKAKHSIQYSGIFPIPETAHDLYACIFQNRKRTDYHKHEGVTAVGNPEVTDSKPAVSHVFLLVFRYSLTHS